MEPQAIPRCLVVVVLQSTQERGPFRKMVVATSALLLLLGVMKNFSALDKSLKLNVDTNDFNLSFTHHVKSVLVFCKTYKFLIWLIANMILLKFVTSASFLRF